MLSYDWLKIVGAAVAGIVVWSLIFTMTATRIRPSQRFTVFNHTSNISFQSTDYYTLRSQILGDNVFSYEVIETGECDLAATPDYASTLLETRLVTDEGSVMFIANTNDTSTAYQDENGETKYQTYLESFTSGSFYSYLANLDMESEKSSFKKLESYLSKFYTDWKTEIEPDASKVEAEFLARAKKNKDKRYKTDAQKQIGIKNDVERIKKYRNALVNVYDYLDKGYISITKVEVEREDYYTHEKITLKGYFFNLCPNEETMGGLKNLVHYPVEYKDENGKTQTKYIVKDMHLAFFNLKGVEDGFQYESFLFLDNLVQKYCTELKK